MTDKLNDFEDLRSTSFEEYIKELKKPWESMQEDTNLAIEIIGEHHPEGNSIIKFVDRVDEEADDFIVQFPQWQSDLQNAFVKKYGTFEGKIVFHKIMMRLFETSRQNANEAVLH